MVSQIMLRQRTGIHADQDNTHIPITNQTPHLVSFEKVIKIQPSIFLLEANFRALKFMHKSRSSAFPVLDAVPSLMILPCKAATLYKKNQKPNPMSIKLLLCWRWECQTLVDKVYESP